jgi:hypothetical protein
MIPLEQRPPLQTIIFICEHDGIIKDSEIIAINQEFCCPFCCEPVDIEFEDIFVKQEDCRTPEKSFDQSCRASAPQGLRIRNAGLSLGSDG